jgi:hypothetical protein
MSTETQVFMIGDSGDGDDGSGDMFILIVMGILIVIGAMFVFSQPTFEVKSKSFTTDEAETKTDGFKNLGSFSINCDKGALSSFRLASASSNSSQYKYECSNVFYNGKSFYDPSVGKEEGTDDGWETFSLLKTPKTINEYWTTEEEDDSSIEEETIIKTTDGTDYKTISNLTEHYLTCDGDDKHISSIKANISNDKISFSYTCKTMFSPTDSYTLKCTDKKTSSVSASKLKSAYNLRSFPTVNCGTGSFLTEVQLREGSSEYYYKYRCCSVGVDDSAW